MILRRVARPLLSSIFIMGGINALRHKEGHAEAAKPLVDKAVDKTVGDASQVPENVPTDPVTLVQVDAGVKIVGGAMLALGVLPRMGALLLLGSLVPTTMAGHPFWEEKDPEQRQQQMTDFLKNAGLAGGLMLAAADTGGKPSLRWRTRHAVAGAGQQMQDTASTVQRRAEKATAKAGKAGRRAGTLTGQVGKAGHKGGMLTGQVGKAGQKATVLSGKAGKAAGKAKGKAGKTVRPVLSR
jgi:uncharacterized membrane protein YphA (DoxX/SURF4 family)